MYLGKYTSPAKRFVSQDKLSYDMKKNVPWHIPAPERGCASSLFPMARSAHPRGAFCITGELSYDTKNGIWNRPYP